MTTSPLSIQFLGAVRVSRAGQELKLPNSKKTKALLAYLAVTQRSHRRERLCDMLWDVADDPRGALRWSLSKLRRAVDEGDERRIIASRESVEFVPGSALIDVLALRNTVNQGVGRAATEELEALARTCRGEFLEGLEMSDFMDFQAWCIAEREEIRRRQAALFEELVHRGREQPERGVEHARVWVQLDPLSITARVALVEALFASGRRDVAAHQVEVGLKTLTELGVSGREALEETWARLQQTESPANRVEPASGQVAAAPASPQLVPEALKPVPNDRFVGRDKELTELLSALSDARERGSQRVRVLSGEPGLGKTTLAERVIAQSVALGGLVLRAKAYDAEGHRPYGLWADALQSPQVETPLDVRTLLQERDDEEGESNRDRFFATIGDFVADCCSRHDHLLLVIDDLQWIDADSIELLHYVIRMSRQRPLMVLLLARGGELADNEAALRVLRGLRRDFGARDIELTHMSRAEVLELLSNVDPDAARTIFDACAGNPLYALELSRSSTESGPLASVVDAVRDRVDRISGYGPELLRWCAVLGHEVEMEVLEEVTSEGLEGLVEGLDTLERHGLLTTGGSGSEEVYCFAHDVVREAIYSQMSHPRRRLMHKRVAEVYGKQPLTVRQAIKIAHHAGLAGDAGASVDACVRAGRHLLRVYANGEAANLARRGLHHAARLEEPARTQATIELLQVQYGAGIEFTEEVSERLQTLANQALDYGLTQAASLAFHLVSFLTWDNGDLVRAHELMMNAERVSRMVDGDERATALAEAARCLVLVEKNLGQADAFTLEAQALADRSHASPSIPRARGMLRAHRADYAQARTLFEESRLLAQGKGDRISEFFALEELTMVEIDTGNIEQARRCSEALVAMAARLREGSENFRAISLNALAGWALGIEGATTELEDGKRGLLAVDSKYHLSYVLTREAQLWLDMGDLDKAQERAEAGREAASTVHRTSELVRAHLVLLDVAVAAGHGERVRSELDALEGLRTQEMSTAVSKRVFEALASHTGN